MITSQNTDYNKIAIIQHVCESSFSSSSFGCGAGDYKFSPGKPVGSQRGDGFFMQINFCIPQQLLDIEHVTCINKSEKIMYIY